MSTTIHASSPSTEVRPWPALWALVIGFFMILVDSTIVSVANPAILRDLQTDITAVIWVTSAYLLAYATPLLITGRLGDRFGPRRVYLIGLVVFTCASAWCGLSDSVAMLILARTVQGLGAALMTPQTMSVITRVFPPQQRGRAMSLWGAVAGVATLVGPIAGGLLVDGLGWEWIFFVNVPVGVVAFVLALRLVPVLPTTAHSFDWLGVALSAVGLFLVIFGLQEGETYHWGTISGPISVWSLIVAGLVVLAILLVWQSRNPREPLIPLGLFADRNFSLANSAITLVGLAVTAMPLPILFYFQVARGLSPTQSALMMSPLAVASLAMAPVVGRLVDKTNPRNVAVVGFVVAAAGLFWMSAWLTPDRAYGWLLLPALVLGLGMSGIWAPLAATATRNLPVTKAGAGSGVYNMTRQVGAVVGSAAVAALINARLAAELPGAPAGSSAEFGGTLPAAAQAGFSAAMGQALLLPAIVLLVGVVAVAFFERPQQRVAWGTPVDTRQPARR